jgi:hypothetical protein
VTKREEERQAREAAQKAREAKDRREYRNAYAREHRAWKKAEAARKLELSKLIGALGVLGSEHAGERAAAALHVERLRAKLGKQWKDLIQWLRPCARGLSVSGSPTLPRGNT